MNISRLNIPKIFIALAFLWLPVQAVSQIYNFEILQDGFVEFQFYSCPTAAQVTLQPSNGDYVLTGFATCSPNQPPYNLTYDPDPGFLGLDTMKIRYYVSDPISSQIEKNMTLIFNVVPIYVDAQDDIVYVPINTSMTIDVMENDSSNVNLTLLNVPLVNHGETEIVSGQVSFTPSNDFVGITYFNYTVCDSTFSACDVGKVTVYVQDNSASVDTTKLVTLKNQPIEILIPLNNGHQELLQPAEGSITIVDDRMTYHPNDDFVGQDVFTYGYNMNGNTSIATFIIEVLWTDDPNNFAVNDYIFTTLNTPVSFNVLDNDLHDNISVIVIGPTEKGGTVTNNQNGNLTYLPPSNTFKGLDQFNYTAIINGTASEEEATVFIIVNNQNPEATSYDLITPMGVPLILNYEIPITNYDFVIQGQGVHGEVKFYEGEFSDWYPENIINGQVVNGYNIVTYTPYEEDFIGADEFEIQYCVDGDCQLVKINVEVVEIAEPQADTLCVGDCVWAGDANYDGKVCMRDLLPIGYCVGDVGSERINGSIDWYGQFADNWNGYIGNTPTNIKHVDTDGDGYIEAADTSALSEFYGNYHDLTSEALPPYVNIPLFFVPKTPNPQPGDIVITDIVLGIPNLPAIDIHGLTFALNFNEDIIEPGTMEVNFFNSNWMAYNSPMLSMVKQPWLGRVEAGYTRATGISVHGYGVIGQVSFIVNEDIDGHKLKDSEVFKTIVRAGTPIIMNSAGRFGSIDAHDFELYITKRSKEDTSNDQLFLFPNPTSDVVNVHLNGNNEIEQLVVYSITGQIVHRMDNINSKQAQLNIPERIANGIYIVSAITEKGVMNAKVEILR